MKINGVLETYNNTISLPEHLILLIIFHFPEADLVSRLKHVIKNSFMIFLKSSSKDGMFEEFVVHWIKQG